MKKMPSAEKDTALLPDRAEEDVAKMVIVTLPGGIAQGD